jgi:hypothetical protein
MVELDMHKHIIKPKLENLLFFFLILTRRSLFTLFTVVHGTVLLFENLKHIWERWFKSKLSRLQKSPSSAEVEIEEWDEALSYSSRSVRLRFRPGLSLRWIWTTDETVENKRDRLRNHSRLDRSTISTRKTLDFFLLCQQ